jgi:hypothetical protein
MLCVSLLLESVSSVDRGESEIQAGMEVVEIRGIIINDTFIIRIDTN